MENSTEVNEFIFLGLTDVPELQIPLFIIFTLIYLITLAGNLGMIALILWDSHLHTPMYFFLSNLSLVDFGYSSAVTPKVMAGLLTGDKVISYNGCGTQLFFFATFTTVENFFLGWLEKRENFFLASMAYDRHMAVCKPLYYTMTMTSGVCARLAIGCYIFGFLTSSVSVGDTFSLSFCSSNVIHHFFCGIPPLLAFSCSNIHINEWVLFILGGFNISFALITIFTSYLFVLMANLKIRSAEGRKKAFSTCASHLIAVSIFYGTIIFMYLQPNSSNSMDIDKMASVFYTMIIPMLNPLVYSLRNKEVKNAFRKSINSSFQGITSLFPAGHHISHSRWS